MAKLQSRLELIELHRQLQDQFSHGGFLLRKWNSNDQVVLHNISPELRDSQSMFTIPESYIEYVKTLGIEWNANLEHFCLTVANTMFTRARYGTVWYSFVRIHTRLFSSVLSANINSHPHLKLCVVIILTTAPTKNAYLSTIEADVFAQVTEEAS